MIRRWTIGLVAMGVALGIQAHAKSLGDCDQHSLGDENGRKAYKVCVASVVNSLNAQNEELREEKKDLQALVMAERNQMTAQTKKAHRDVANQE